MAILHIYGARAVFLIFCVHQDTESDSCEIEMSTSQPIFTHKNISKALWENISILYKMGGKYCGSYSYLWRFINFLTILRSPRH